LLANGQVLIAGGSRAVELYDPVLNRFREVSDRFDEPYFYATATALLDGRVLITGGYDASITSTANTWFYVPDEQP
jgi:hypothetical protein